MVPAIRSTTYLHASRQNLDLEYRFDQKIATSVGDKTHKWKTMTFGKEDTPFSAGDRVKLASKNLNWYGTIKHFETEVGMDT